MAVKRPFLLLTTGIAILTLLALATPAQAQNASGIRGVVLDKDGQPIPGATVVVSNPDLGVSSQGGVTDAKGEFRISPLPPGRGYRLSVAFQDMAKVEIADIEVSASRMSNQPVTLRPASEMKERVKVTAKSDVVNTTTAETSTTITSEFIDALPILGRNYQDILTLAPGVSDTEGTGNPNIHGARDTDVITLVDGVSTTDPVTGQRGQELNIESIQEIEVKTSGASAEFSRGQGGFINIITKSGGNDFEGSFQFNWRSNIFDGDGAGLDNPQLHGGLGELGLRDLHFNDYTPFLSLGGPIRKDRAWYFFTAEYIQLEEPVNALTQAFVRGTKEKRVFGKLSWDMSTNHKLVFTATWDPRELSNLGLDSLTAVESGYTNREGGLNLVLKETAVFNPNVFLETTVQQLRTAPRRIPTLDADTNGNGRLFVDYNNNHIISDASDRDAGEDFDRDGKFDVFERNLEDDAFFFTNPHTNRGDGDGRKTEPGTWSNGRLIPGGCEGDTREDYDCDGRLDNIKEDLNGNGRCDEGEVDSDSDGQCEPGTEDRNHNTFRDDRPVLFPDDPRADENGRVDTFYPYGHPVPTPRDRDLTFDGRTGRTSGPDRVDFDGDRGRVTLRQDLTVFVPDWFGQHEMKVGGVVEREHYNQTTRLRPFVLDDIGPPVAAGTLEPRVGVILPAESKVGNEATNTTFGVYVTDTYKPRPNLTIGLGLRFDREATDSFGYTPFDPTAERTLYNRINNLAGVEGQHSEGEESTLGNNDGIVSHGYCTDPIFEGLGANPCKSNPTNNDLVTRLQDLHKAAAIRLTQHHTSTELVAQNLVALFPEAVREVDGVKIIDRKILQDNGLATFQEEEPFRLTNNNLAPRLSISWDPFADSKTKIFLSWSRFYDKLFLNVVTPEEGPDTISRYYVKDADGLSGAGVPNNQFGSPISKAPPSTTQVDRGLSTPFTDEWTVGFERELAPELALRLSYINRKGRQGLQDIDINHNLRFDENGQPLDALGRFVTTNTGGIGRGSDNKPDLYIQNFFFNQIFRVGNFNESRYHGIEAQVTKRLSRKWQMDASYTYSRAVGAAEAFNSALGDDAATQNLEFGYLNFDQRHVVKLNASTFLPGDWQLSGALSWASGLPYSTVTFFSALDNYDYLSNRLLYGQIVKEQAGARWIPERRNARRNDSVYNINVKGQKAFVLGHLNSKLFLEVQNLLNTDDLRIRSNAPTQPDRNGFLELNAERRFGRRWSVGFQFDF